MKPIVDEISKYQQVSEHPLLRGYVPSSKTPHLDALEQSGLMDQLTIEQCARVVILAQTAYRKGQADQGAQKIDDGAVWLDGVGGLERQTDGTWKLTMPDGSAGKSAIAAAMGSMTSERKAKSSAENGRLGGRPRKAKSSRRQG